MNVRKAELHDAQAIARIKVDTWRSTYGSFLEPATLDRLSVEKEAERWRQRLLEDSGAWVAVDVEEVVGFGVFGENRYPEVPCDAELYAIYVHPISQRRGAGLALMRAGVEALVRQGFGSMVVFVFQQNEFGVNFYRSLGAELYGQGIYPFGGRSYPDESYVWKSLQELQKRLTRIG